MVELTYCQEDQSDPTKTMTLKERRGQRGPLNKQPKTVFVAIPVVCENFANFYDRDEFVAKMSVLS